MKFRILKNLQNPSVEDILIRSSNIGTLIIARKIGQENLRSLLQIQDY